MTRAEFIYLMQRLQGGDTRALAPLYEEYFPKMKATAFAVLRNVDDAYDVATNAFLKLADAPFDPASVRNPAAYLAAMAGNEARNFLKRRSREVSADFSCDPEPPSSAPSDSLWLDDLFRALDAKEGELVLLHVVWGLPLKEVARQLNMPYSTAKLRFHTAKEKLRRAWKA